MFYFSPAILIWVNERLPIVLPTYWLETLYSKSSKVLYLILCISNNISWCVHFRYEFPKFPLHLVTLFVRYYVWVIFYIIAIVSGAVIVILFDFAVRRSAKNCNSYAAAPVPPCGLLPCASTARFYIHICSYVCGFFFSLAHVVAY